MGKKGRAHNAASIKKEASYADVERAAKKQSFLDNFPDYGTIYHTAKFIGVHHSTVIDWLNADAAFGEAFKKIKTVPGYMIERAAIERAKDSKSQADTLRIFMLKNLLPDSYGEADKIQLEITVTDVLVTNFISIIQQEIPNFCPHCKTDMRLSETIVKRLVDLSERMMKTRGAVSASESSRT